jgi:hypothetical protein
MTNKKSNESRRKLLKSIAAGGGMVAAGQSLPEKWMKPVVDAALLPAHAQTSGCNIQCRLQITLSWAETESDLLDLLVQTAGGTMIDPKGQTTGQCLAHQGENLTDSSTNERVKNIGNERLITAGTYRIFIRKNIDNDEADVTLRVKTCDQQEENTSICLNSSFDGVFEAGMVVVNPNGSTQITTNNTRE